MVVGCAGRVSTTVTRVVLASSVMVSVITLTVGCKTVVVMTSGVSVKVDVTTSVIKTVLPC
jgi:hypothetical protein